MQSIDDQDNNKALLIELPSIEPNVQRNLENKEFEKEIQIVAGPLNSRESEIFGLYLEGYSCKEIAAQLGDNPKLITFELNAVRAKVRYRVTKQHKTAKP